MSTGDTSDAALKAHVASELASQQTESPDAAIDAVAENIDTLFWNKTDETEKAPEQARAPDGKFAKPADKQEAAEKTDEAEDDGEYFEVEETGEDGKPALKRYKADEVWQGFQKAKELEAELTKARAEPHLSADHEQIIADTLRHRGQYIQALQQWQRFNQPAQPDMEMLNPQSQKYDPESYYRGMQQYRSTVENHERVAAELQRQGQAQSEQQKLLETAHHRREREALLKAWPEIAKPEVAKEVANDLQKHFGIDEATLKNVYDHRFYAIAKAALAHVKGQAKAAEAVKIVRSKPKLVKGQARGTQNPNQARAEAAMARLQKSGSMEDAFAGIEALLN